MLDKWLSMPKPTAYTDRLNKLEATLIKSRDLTYMLNPTYIKPICINTVDLSNELDETIKELRTMRKEVGI